MEKEVFGNDLTKRITITTLELEKLRFTEAVIKEVTRHSPVAFQVSRSNIEIDEVGGYVWPANTSFQMLFAALMKRKEYWTDPEKFDPDRFYKMDEDDKYLLER